MKNKIVFLIAVVFLISLACQSVTRSVSTSSEESIPQATPTLEPITEKSLAGLVINSPALGIGPGPYMGDVPVKGLGIFNKDGYLIKFSEAGYFAGYSSSGPHIIYQFFESGSDSSGKLRSFNIVTGDTVEIKDNLDGEKNILGWLPSSPSKFIYENNLEAYLFEAYGYFEGREILLADAETGESNLLLDHTFQLDLNPDQTQLAYTTGEINETPGEHMQEGSGCFQPQVYDLSSSTSSKFNISQLSEVPLCLGYPNWSPDGKRIAWIGYFQDDTFRTVIFNASDGKGIIYNEMDVYAGSQFRSGWNLGNTVWLDNSIFWTEDYEINSGTGKVSEPRENPTPSESILSSFSSSATRPDGLIVAGLGKGDGMITVSDIQGNQLAAYSLEQLYKGDGNDYGFDQTEFMATYIAGWLPIAPAAGVENNIQSIPSTIPPTIHPTNISFSCPNAPRTRLQVGDTARITFTDGTSTFLRSAPEAGDNVIDKLPEGTEFEIISGPVCYPRPDRNDAYVYWEISVPSRNVKGWVAEGDSKVYYIEPWP